MSIRSTGALAKSLLTMQWFHEIMTSSAIFAVNVFSGRACSPHQSLLQVKHQFWYPTLDAAKCGKTMDGSHQCSISALSKANPLESSEAVSCRAGSSWPERTSDPSSETQIPSWGLPAEDSWKPHSPVAGCDGTNNIAGGADSQRPSRCPWLSPACSQDHCMVWSMNSQATITCFATATNGALTSPRPALSIEFIRMVFWHRYIISYPSSWTGKGLTHNKLATLFKLVVYLFVHVRFKSNKHNSDVSLLNGKKNINEPYNWLIISKYHEMRLLVTTISRGTCL